MASRTAASRSIFGRALAGFFAASGFGFGSSIEGPETRIRSSPSNHHESTDGRSATTCAGISSTGIAGGGFGAATSPIAGGATGAGVPAATGAGADAGAGATTAAGTGEGIAAARPASGPAPGSRRRAGAATGRASPAARQRGQRRGHVACGHRQGRRGRGAAFGRRLGIVLDLVDRAAPDRRRLQGRGGLLAEHQPEARSNRAARPSGRGRGGRSRPIRGRLPRCRRPGRSRCGGGGRGGRRRRRRSARRRGRP